MSIAALALLLSGCHTNIIELGDGDGPGGGGGDNNSSLIVLDRSQLNQQIYAESRVCEVTFTTQLGWELSFSDDPMHRWISVSPTRAEYGGQYTLSINVDENTSGYERPTTLYLYSDGESETITIRQSGQRSDGTTPPPYQEDTYTDIVERVIVQSFTNGEPDLMWREWRFGYNGDRIGFMELFQYTPEGENLLDQIYVQDRYAIERNVYGVKTADGWYELVYKYYSELTVNEQNFITQERVQEFNYRDESSEEPRLYEQTVSYKDYRRVVVRRSDGPIAMEYHWVDGNQIQLSEVNTVSGEKNTIQSYVYRSELNDRANIDLNALLAGDMFSVAGVFGKRSQNLLSSFTDHRGGVVNFVYTFDEQQRVATITRTYAAVGSVDPISTLFTVYYQGSSYE